MSFVKVRGAEMVLLTEAWGQGWVLQSNHWFPVDNRRTCAWVVSFRSKPWGRAEQSKGETEGIAGAGLGAVGVDVMTVVSARAAYAVGSRRSKGS